MTISYWQGQAVSLSPNYTSDVLIVGGGFVGLGVAYWLTEFRPDLNILILEKDHCGSGASGKNAGFLTCGSAAFYKSLSLKWGEDKALEINKYALDSLNLLSLKILKTMVPNKIEKISSLTLFQQPEQHMKWISEQFNPELFQFHWKKKQELPLALQGGFAGAYEHDSEFKINPVDLIGTLKDVLLSRKVRILEGMSAFEITSSGVRTENCRIDAKQVVLALNGYFSMFAEQFKELIKPKRAQMLAIEFDGPFKCPALHYDPADRVYWRTVSDKQLIIGGKRLLDEENENCSWDTVSPLIQDGLETYIKNHLKLKHRVLRRWSGTMGFTANELPIISKIKSKNEAYMIGGFSGHGLGFGFKAAMDLAEIICSKKTESLFSQYHQSSINL